MDILRRRLEFVESLLHALAVCETPNELGMALVTKVFPQEQLRQAFIFRASDLSTLTRLGGYGDPRVRRYGSDISIWERTSITEAFREDRIVRVNDASEYALTYDISYLPPESQGIISFPLHESGKVVGSVALIFGVPLSAYGIGDDDIRLVEVCANRILRDWRRRTHGHGDTSEDSFAVPQLTERQHVIVNLLGSGKTLREIGSDLSVSEATVKAEVQKIYRAMGVNKRREALQSARRHGMIGPVEN